MRGRRPDLKKRACVKKHIKTKKTGVEIAKLCGLSSRQHVNYYKQIINNR